MIELTAVAERHLAELEAHYLALERYKALLNLRAAFFEAAEKIERDPSAGKAAPAPYRGLARPGRLWMKAGRYWFTYAIAPTLTITGIFYESANIPGRI